MEFIQLYANEANGKNIEVAVEETDEAAELGDFIDDESTSSFQENIFYRALDNNLDNRDNDESEWMINKDSQVENYTSCGIINLQYDEFSIERERLDKFSEVCCTLGKGSKDSFF